MALARKITSKIYEIQAHTSKVTCLDVGETGRVLVTGGQDKNVNLWAFGNDKCFMSLSGHNRIIDCVKFANNDNYVYSADDSGIIKQWNLEANSECSTFLGHMKSVKTMDFHPFGEYMVTGSNDTTVRLWDTRDTVCLKKYRGHIDKVNSVKFSPDGSWIASAGTEGSVIIWDIRMSKQIIEIPEHASPVTCIKFHPSEFLLAAGRNDGSIDLYDLESKKLVSRTDRNPFMGHTVKCLIFSEVAECLFAGTAEGISVIGWEPHREFDYIESTWSILGDMKVINQKLICGAFENTYVGIHALSIDQLFPFYNPSNTPFSYSHSSRKSFSRGTGKLRLSINNKGNSDSSINTNNDGGMSSPNLSFEMINEEDSLTAIKNGIEFENYELIKTSNPFDCSMSSNSSKGSPDKFNTQSPPNNLLTTKTNIAKSGHISLKLENEKNNYYKSVSEDSDYYPIKNKINNVNSNNNLSNMNINNNNHSNNNNILNKKIKNNIQPERENFPVNNAQAPDYAPKLSTATSHLAVSKSFAARPRLDRQRRFSPPNLRTSNKSNLTKTMVSSVSTMELTKIEDHYAHSSTFSSNKTNSRNNSPVRDRFNNYNKPHITKRNESHHQATGRSNKNIPVNIYTKPVRAKTAIDIKPPTSYIKTSMSQDLHGLNSTSNENHAMQLLTTCHESVYNALCNRHATLQIVRKSTRLQDVFGALKTIIKMNDRAVLVDILGAILEKESAWTLDMCVLLLPEIYELLQSDYSFHCLRACDALRLILKNFLSIIQSNLDPWGPARSLGVDITREERQNKCIECKHWLIKIKLLPEINKIGWPNLSALQNMIVDI